VNTLLKITKPDQEFRITDTQTDNLGQTHIRLAQTHNGVAVYGAELVAHLTDGAVSTLNGQYRLVPDNISITPKLNQTSAADRAFQDVGKESIVRSFGDNLLKMKPSEGELCLFPMEDGSLKLAYQLTVRPNLLERWQYVIDAQTGDVLDKFNHTCGVDGPAKATGRDLNNVARTLDTYSKGGQFYLIDASRKMYSTANATKIPDNPLGVIWTIDARNTVGDKQEIYQITSANNTNWSPLAISAHYNAGVAYLYYLNTHNRNALNNKGGTMISVVNIPDEDDGKGMDNAYWNGEYMAYGNGRTYFKPLAGSLDVAGHEMTHGVVENSANLEYKSQSGAINESMADIFGCMIDRANWTLGEDVILNRSYPSGALRSLSNPNQGGKTDPGYQPRTMSQYNNTTQDNGGVHINSGIPNYAFYLFATATGMTKEKAEKVYYRALTTYLTRTSKFIDLRLAVLKATADLLGGTTGSDYKAAQAAFDAVGIVESTTTTPSKTPDVPTAQGQDLMLIYGSDNKLYSTVVGSSTFTLRSSAGLRHRPSITDNGQNAVYVGTDKKIRSLVLTGTATESIISADAIWDNAAISKDGTKLAALTSQADGSVWVYSYAKQKWKQFKLYNPTTANGVTSGAVKYADSFEWDFTGEYIVYDGYNEVKSADGSQLNYWDVGFIRAWDNTKNDFGDGTVDKLFSNLDEGESVGNPSYSKNSPDIIAFDYIYNDGSSDSYYVVAADLNSGNLELVYENNTFGYPNYSRTDGRLVFNNLSSGSQKNIGVINLASNKISPSGNLSTLISRASWPVWYTQATRALPQKTAQTISFGSLTDRYTDQPTFTVSATSSANLPVAFAVQSGPAEVSGNRVTITGPGKVTIRAYQEGNNQYLAATPIDQSFTVLAILGLEPAWADALKVYPNPATSVLTIEIPKQETIAEALLTNLNGVSVKRVTPTTPTSSVQFDMRNIPRGIYTVTVKTESGRVSRQVVKE
jgi:bacillolysin